MGDLYLSYPQVLFRYRVRCELILGMHNVRN